MLREKTILHIVYYRFNSALGKIELEGTLAQRLEQLDRRETELLEEIKQLKLSSKKIKEDRQHYRTKADEKM